MKILITGATGLIGQELGRKLCEDGHSLVVVSRSKKKAMDVLPYPAQVIEWDLMRQPLTSEHFKEIDAIIHLLGETVDGRWTAQKKKEILDSRVLSSKNLLQNVPTQIKTIVTAAALGFYGDRGQSFVDENSPPGEGFLADVCQKWEEPFQKIKKKLPSIRVVIVRLGVVLSHRGGALKKLIGLFQKNLGAPLGNGQQWMSWISLQDASDIFKLALTDSRFEGVINAVHPQPVQNKKFTEDLCRSLQVTSLPSVPALVLKTLLGEMSSVVLDSCRVDCVKLKQNKFPFQFEDLALFFEKELDRFKAGQGFFCAQQFIAADIEKVFPFFATAENLERITPRTLQFKIVQMSTEKIQQGTLIDYQLKIHGVPAKWRTLI